MPGAAKDRRQPNAASGPYREWERRPPFAVRRAKLSANPDPPPPSTKWASVRLRHSIRGNWPKQLFAMYPERRDAVNLLIASGRLRYRAARCKPVLVKRPTALWLSISGLKQIVERVGNRLVLRHFSVDVVHKHSSPVFEELVHHCRSKALFQLTRQVGFNQLVSISRSF